MREEKDEEPFWLGPGIPELNKDGSEERHRSEWGRYYFQVATKGDSFKVQAHFT